MTEEELVQAFRAVLVGERQRIQRAAQEKGHRQLVSETHGVRQIFRFIHPDGESVVNNWIDEVKRVR